MFRAEIQRILSEKFEFYAMTAHPDIDAEIYIKEHFQEVLGKIYTPYSNKNIFSLALETDEKYKEDNANLLAEFLIESRTYKKVWNDVITLRNIIS